MPSDVQLVKDNVLLIGNDVFLIGGSVIARCDLLRHEGSPLVLSTRDLFITWSLTRANLHIGSTGVRSGSTGDERDDGRHATGHAVRIEGEVFADDLWLVSWQMTDPQKLADDLEFLLELRDRAGMDRDEHIDVEELLPAEGEPSYDVDALHDHLGEVDASEREATLPSIIEALRNEQPRLVRREESLVARLARIEERLDALEGRT